MKPSQGKHFREADQSRTKAQCRLRELYVFNGLLGRELIQGIKTLNKLENFTGGRDDRLTLGA